MKTTNDIEKGIEVANSLWEEKRLDLCPVCGSRLGYYYDLIEYECEGCPPYHHVAISCKREKGRCYFSYNNFIPDTGDGSEIAWKQLISAWLYWKEKRLEVNDVI